ncbi:MAG: biopolymer transporter ExbD [candidate division KSB1 bacterium]|nr:biopolymer transporter ExbD [candidate division KSB1 bacterium]MDZ7368149.1 biopolymer transporter ExbD [candidate division KSB1 bacterium]MDZ7405827.1 biopolymer transporter ExbD [candidate division KSB1 bacterium]
MAFRPSLRRHLKMESTDLNLTPVMNLMVVMIPMLLSGSQFIKLGIIELNLPPAAGASVAGNPTTALPKEEQRSLDLTISITARGFYLSSALTVLHGKDSAGPTIPAKPDGEYDFVELAKKLHDVKQKAQGIFPDADAIVLQAEKDIKYQTLVDTMDAARMIEIDGKVIELFPRVALSAGVM